MLWQDIVIMAGCFTFAIALVPTVLSKTQKPAWTTCVLSAVVQTAFVVAMATMSMWAATAGNAACAMCWYVLCVQTTMRQVRVKRLVRQFKAEAAKLSPEYRAKIDEIIKRQRENPVNLNDPKQRAEFIDAGVDFVMGASAPDAMLDAQELERRNAQRDNYQPTPKLEKLHRAQETRAKLSDAEWYVEIDGHCVRDGDKGFWPWDCKGHDDSVDNPYRPHVIDLDAHEFVAKAKNLSWPFLVAAVELAEACVQYHATGKTIDRRKEFLASYEAER